MIYIGLHVSDHCVLLGSSVDRENGETTDRLGLVEQRIHFLD